MMRYVPRTRHAIPSQIKTFLAKWREIFCHEVQKCFHLLNAKADKVLFDVRDHRRSLEFVAFAICVATKQLYSWGLIGTRSNLSGKKDDTIGSADLQHN